MAEHYPNFRRAQRKGGPFRKGGTRARPLGFATRVVAASLTVAAATWILTPASPSIAQDTRQPENTRPVYYPNCAAARAAGAAPIYRGQPGYRDALDRDGDGIACEPYRGRSGRRAR